MTDRRRHTPGSVAAVCCAALLAAGCSSSATSSAAGAASTAMTVPAASGEVTVSDQWVRATKGIPDPSMANVFGHFANHTGKDLTIVSAANSLTGRTELHRMSMTGDVMVMGPAVGGITLPANRTTILDPNSLHIMIMNLTSTILPGDDVKVTAVLSDGSKVSFDAIGKEYAGGNESYRSGAATTSPMGGMTGMPGMPGMAPTSAPPNMPAPKSSHG